MRLETERLTVRSVCGDDAQALFRIANDAQVMEYIPDLFGREPALSDIEGYIADFL